MYNKCTKSLAFTLLIATFSSCDSKQPETNVEKTEIETPNVRETKKQGTPMEKNEFETIESGLKHKILKPAEDMTSPRPRQGQKVTVHYTGWLESNNKKFDSSVDRGQPFSFVIGGRRGIPEVIRGWDEGLRLMRVGEKRQFVIPPHLGYGAQGAGMIIPPNATLVFDVELLSIE